MSTSLAIVSALASAGACGAGMYYVMTRRIQKIRNREDRLLAAESTLQEESHRQEERLAQSQDTITKQTRQLDELREALKRRPEYRRAIYNIATVGASGCGKTNLTFRWANPIFRGQIEGTQFSRYTKTVSRQVGQSVVDHCFEILDWGGEFVHEAQAALVRREIHAMLMVVDLGFDPSTKSSSFSEDRIKQQQQQFNEHVMRFFFSPEIIKNCQTVILFINKNDLLPGYPQEIEKKAKEYFRPLIDILMHNGEQHGVSVSVFVGSAETGAGTTRLFAHLIERILNPEDYDEELRATLDNIKKESPAAPKAARVPAGSNGRTQVQ